MVQENTTMKQRVQVVISKYLEKMPLHLQLMVKPFLTQFQQFNDEIDEQKILDFITEIENNIAYIKGTDTDAN